MKKILVGIDGSQASMNAIKYAAKMARVMQADIVAINVINDLSSYNEYYKDISNKLKREAEDVLKRAEAAVQSEGVMIKTQVETGTPDVVLAERAKADPEVAMIVAGASRKGPGTKFFIRSKAHALVDQIAAGLQCPVIVVPGNDEDFLKRI